MAEEVTKTVLARIKKLVNNFSFLHKLSAEEKKFYAKVSEHLSSKLGEGLTEVELHNLVVITMWLDKYDAYEREVGISAINPDLLAQSRMYRTTLLERIKTAREASNTSPSILEDAKTFIAELKKSGEGRIEITWEKPKEVVTTLDLVKIEKERKRTEKANDEVGEMEKVN